MSENATEDCRLDVPHTTGNHTPETTETCLSRLLDVPHTTGNHTPKGDKRKKVCLLDVPHTTGNHTPFFFS